MKLTFHHRPEVPIEAEVITPEKLAGLSEPEPDRHAHRFPVQDRQDPRQTEVDGTGLGVGRGAVSGRRA